LAHFSCGKFGYADLMALEMKKKCEKCGRTLGAADKAFICIYECTFCRDCTGSVNSICPNCGGELVQRPRAGKVPQTPGGVASTKP
jgi:hypothetical protein